MVGSCDRSGGELPPPPDRLKAARPNFPARLDNSAAFAGADRDTTITDAWDKPVVHFPSGHNLPAGVEDANRKLQAWGAVRMMRRNVWDAFKRIDTESDSDRCDADEAAYALKQLRYAERQLVAAIVELGAAYPESQERQPPIGTEYAKLFPESMSNGTHGRREGGVA